MHNKKDCKNLISRIKFGDNSSIFVDILSFSNKTYTEKKQRTISVTMKKNSYFLIRSTELNHLNNVLTMLHLHTHEK